MSLIECKNLSLGYDKTLIQENLNLSIEKGEYVFILGENGSGKSTLIKTILGFIKPYSGSINYSSEWNKKEVGYLPQASEIQKTFPATVWEIVLSGCQSQLGIFPFYKKEHHKKAAENSQAIQKMYDIVADLNKKGLTVITISHDLQAAQKYAGKIINLEKREVLK